MSEQNDGQETVTRVHQKQEAGVVIAKHLQWRLGHNVSFLLVGAGIAFALFGSLQFAGFILLWSALSLVVTALEQHVYRRSDRKFFNKYAITAREYLQQHP